MTQRRYIGGPRVDPPPPRPAVQPVHIVINGGPLLRAADIARIKALLEAKREPPDDVA